MGIFNSIQRNAGMFPSMYGGFEQPVQAPQPQMPQQPAPSFAQLYGQQGGQQQGQGIDIGQIMKIMAMFGGAA